MNVSLYMQGNVVLVDTPGVKEEDDDDNTQLFYHLRKASAFIYIIKTDSAGGTHKVSKECVALRGYHSMYEHKLVSKHTRRSSIPSYRSIDK